MSWKLFVNNAQPVYLHIYGTLYEKSKCVEIPSFLLTKFCLLLLVFTNALERLSLWLSLFMFTMKMGYYDPYLHFFLGSNL